MSNSPEFTQPFAFYRANLDFACRMAALMHENCQSLQRFGIQYADNMSAMLKTPSAADAVVQTNRVRRAQRDAA
jgi:hypothetical protein